MTADPTPAADREHDWDFHASCCHANPEGPMSTATNTTVDCADCRGTGIQSEGSRHTVCRACGGSGLRTHSTMKVYGTERPDMPLEQEAALALVLDERKRQDAKWGEQNHGDLVWSAVLVELDTGAPCGICGQERCRERDRGGDE